MSDSLTTANANSYTSFNGHRRIASGRIQMVALAAKRVFEGNPDAPILIFDDSTGYLIDVDTRGSDEAVLARLVQPTAESVSVEKEPSHTESRNRGRPKLGVVAREVTLLPRHWEWLATQPGGASVALRKLVEEARRANGDKDRTRKAQERAYRFISRMAGNMTDFEEASRALFANNELRFREMTAEWPDDLRDYAIKLAFRGDEADADGNQALSLEA